MLGVIVVVGMGITTWGIAIQSSLPNEALGPANNLQPLLYGPKPVTPFLCHVKSQHAHKMHIYIGGSPLRP